MKYAFIAHFGVLVKIIVSFSPLNRLISGYRTLQAILGIRIEMENEIYYV